MDEGRGPWPGRVSLVRFGHFWDWQWQWCKLDLINGVFARDIYHGFMKISFYFILLKKGCYVYIVGMKGIV